MSATLAKKPYAPAPDPAILADAPETADEAAAAAEAPELLAAAAAPVAAPEPRAEDDLALADPLLLAEAEAVATGPDEDDPDARPDEAWAPPVGTRPLVATPLEMVLTDWQLEVEGVKAGPAGVTVCPTVYPMATPSAV